MRGSQESKPPTQTTKLPLVEEIWSWFVFYHISTPELPSFMRPIDRATNWGMTAKCTLDFEKDKKKQGSQGCTWWIRNLVTWDQRQVTIMQICHVHFHRWNVCCMHFMKCIDMPWNSSCHWRVFCGTHQLHPSDNDTPARPSSRWWCRAGPFAAFLFSGNLWMLWSEKWETSHFFR